MTQQEHAEAEAAMAAQSAAEQRGKCLWGADFEYTRERGVGALATPKVRIRVRAVAAGEPLAKAYASMDIFVFPSSTDTFGNVVLEATASGVPAVVTADGGPKFLVRSGVTGFVAANEAAFIRSILELAGDPELVARMRRAAREYACGRSWDAGSRSTR